MTTSLDRFRLLTVNELQLPHKCGICGSFTGENDKHYIFFDFFVEFYGNLYICTDCIVSAAQLVGLVKQCNHQQQLDELRAVVKTLIEENKELRDYVDSLRDRLINHSYADSDSLFSSPALQVEERAIEPEQQQSNSVETSGEGEGGETGSDEPVDVGGSEDLPDDDNGNPLRLFDSI